MTDPPELKIMALYDESEASCIVAGSVGRLRAGVFRNLSETDPCSWRGIRQGESFPSGYGSDRQNVTSGNPCTLGVCRLGRTYWQAGETLEDYHVGTLGISIFFQLIDPDRVIG